MPDERTGGNGATAGGAGPARTGLRTIYYIAAVVLAMLVPLTLFAGFWIREEFAKGQKDLESYLETRAAALVQRVDAGLDEEIAVLQAIAALPSLDEPDLTAFDVQAARMVAAMPDWTAISLLDAASGRAVLNTQPPASAPLPEVAAADVLAQVRDGRRPAIRSWAAGERGDADPMVLLFVPVQRGDAVRHVLVAGARLPPIQRLLPVQGDDPRLLALIVDGQGRILARAPTHERLVAREANPELRQLTEGRDGGVFTAPTPDGESVFTAFRRSPATGWLFVVATDRQQLDRIARRSNWTIVAAAGLSLTIAAILAVFLFYNVMESRLNAERLAASRALSELDARLLATTQEALADQRKAASEREVLLREIYHRVKNNLQIVQSLLRLGSRDLASEQREAFESAIRRIGAMARVHTLLYNSPDLGSIDFSEYLQGLAREVAEAFGAQERNIRTTVEAEPMQVPLDTAVPLAFIAVEVLTNAFKHAFPPGRGGTVAASLSRDGDQGVLVISDDGQGLKPREPGRRPLGLTMVSKLVQQIGGTLDQPREGQSTFRVAFPLSGPGKAPEFAEAAE